jgi:hypothetical protein
MFHRIHTGSMKRGGACQRIQLYKKLWTGDVEHGFDTLQSVVVRVSSRPEVSYWAAELYTSSCDYLFYLLFFPVINLSQVTQYLCICHRSIEAKIDDYGGNDWRRQTRILIRISCWRRTDLSSFRLMTTVYQSMSHSNKRSPADHLLSRCMCYHNVFNVFLNTHEIFHRWATILFHSM